MFNEINILSNMLGVHNMFFSLLVVRNFHFHHTFLAAMVHTFLVAVVVAHHILVHHILGVVAVVRRILVLHTLAVEYNIFLVFYFFQTFVTNYLNIKMRRFCMNYSSEKKFGLCKIKKI